MASSIQAGYLGREELLAVYLGAAQEAHESKSLRTMSLKLAALVSAHMSPHLGGAQCSRRCAMPGCPILHVLSSHAPLQTCLRALCAQIVQHGIAL